MHYHAPQANAMAAQSYGANDRRVVERNGLDIQWPGALFAQLSCGW